MKEKEELTNEKGWKQAHRRGGNRAVVFVFVFFLKHMIHNVSEISKLLSNKDEQGPSRTSLQPSD